MSYSTNGGAASVPDQAWTGVSGSVVRVRRTRERGAASLGLVGGRPGALDEGVGGEGIKTINSGAPAGLRRAVARRQRPPRDQQGLDGADRGWTVFGYRPPLASLRAVGSKMGGLDRALAAVSDSVPVLDSSLAGRRRRAAPRVGPGMRQRSGEEARARRSTT